MTAGISAMMTSTMIDVVERFAWMCGEGETNIFSIVCYFFTFLDLMIPNTWPLDWRM